MSDWMFFKFLVSKQFPSSRTIPPSHPIVSASRKWNGTHVPIPSTSTFANTILMAKCPSSIFFAVMCLSAITASWLTLSRMLRRTGNSENMSPDSPSTLFPDRPIRPLPKRRLRERLSPDVADSIQYPPAPQNTAPLFAYPYNNKDDLTSLASDPLNAAHRENSAALGQEASQRRNGLGTDQDDYSILGQARRTFVSRPIHDATGAIRTPLRQAQARQSNPQQPPSTASSVDGYDSFENSNNKKKRKIPTAGETILNGTHVLNELGALGVSSPIATGDEGSLDPSGTTSAAYYQSGGTGTSGQGISGPGRGRYGRVRSGRSPLRTLSDPNSSWGSRISNKLRPGGIQYPPQPAGTLVKLDDTLLPIFPSISCDFFNLFPVFSSSSYRLSVFLLSFSRFLSIN